MLKLQKVIFRQIAETAHRASSTEAAYSDHFNSSIHSISMAGCVTPVLALSAGNSQPGRQAVSVMFEN